MPITLKQGVVIDNRYELLHMIGRGGMGEVWLARQRGLEREVAIKFTLIDEYEFTPAKIREYLDRFKREAASLGRLGHPNVIQAYDYGVVEDTPFLVMEYFAKGVPLQSWGRREKPTIRQWLGVARQLLSALAHAHALGILHRDLKSGNVLARGTAEAPEVKIIDWGIAFRLDRTKLTQDGKLIGTFGLTIDPMALRDPENFVPTPESDFYALGGLLYALVCGARALAVEPDAPITKLLTAASINEIIAPHVANPAVSGDLEIFLQKMLATAPEERPPNAHAALAIVDALLAQPEIGAGPAIDFDAIYARYAQAGSGFDARSVEKTAVGIDDPAGSEPQAVVSDDIVATPASGAATSPITSAPTAMSRAHGAQGAANAMRGGGQKSAERRAVSAAVGEGGATSHVTPPQTRGRWARWGVMGLGVIALGGVLGLLTQERARRAMHEVGTLPGSAPPSADSMAPERVSPPAQPPSTRAEPSTTPAEPPTTALPPTTSSTRAPRDTAVPRDLPPRPNHKEKRPVPPPESAAEPQLSITPAKTPPSFETLRQRIPHRYQAAAVLLDMLDTASAEPLRARLREPIVVAGETLVPVGVVLWGRAVVVNGRAHASFDRLVFRDNRELTIAAIAVTPDGREGFDEGRIELLERQKGVQVTVPAGTKMVVQFTNK